MKRLILTRFCHAPDDMGTFGFLTIDGVPNKRWWTVERPWNGNQPCTCRGARCECGSSCIPLGAYQLRRGTYTANGKLSPGYPDLEFVYVPGRANIEIHAANRAEELKGCIAPGKLLQLASWSVGRSRDALTEIILGVGDDDEIEIEICMG